MENSPDVFFSGMPQPPPADPHLWFRVDLSAHAFSHVHTRMSAVFVALEHLSLRIVPTLTAAAIHVAI